MVNQPDRQKAPYQKMREMPGTIRLAKNFEKPLFCFLCSSYPNAIVHAYLSILSRIPDSHIARKKGIDAARLVSSKAAHVICSGGVFTQKGLMEIESFDRFLRTSNQSLNSGTTADLADAAMLRKLFQFSDAILLK
jgi:triphosphoribosyl-dephospho-CoA synthetase